MKIKNYKVAFLAIAASFLVISCGDDDTDGNTNPDFSGTYSQADIMGRPAINTVLSGTSENKNAYNVSIPTERESFTSIHLGTLVAYHDAFGVSYETNILNLDGMTFATVLSQFDALQVAPDAPTSYFNPNTGLALTGRALADDVVDVTLILAFGGNSGAKYNGENGTPELVSDNVGQGTRVFGTTFPYLEAAIN